MESKKLEALLLAVDLGSFTKAAEILGYTQSGLTHMMNSLEKEVGFPLLERGRHGVRLSNEGELLAPAIRNFLQANSVLDNTITQISTQRRETIRVAAYASMAKHWLPDILYQFRKECPDIDVELRISDYVNEPFDLLRQYKTDIIFVSHQAPVDYEWIPLYDETLYAVLPQDYPVSNRTTFPLQEFEGKEFLMPSGAFDRDVLRFFEALEVHPDIRPTSVDDTTVVRMVSHGLGVSMMAELMIRGRTEPIITLPIAPACVRKLGLGLRSWKEAPASQQKFIECVKRMVPKL